METKEGPEDKGAKGSDEAKAAAVPEKDVADAKAADKPADEKADEKAGDEKAADHEPDEAKAAEDKAAVEDDDKPPIKPAAAIVRAAPPPDGSRATVAGVIALVILLGGVLMSVFIMRRNDAAAKQERTEKRGKRGGGERKKEPPWQIGQKVPVSITVIAEDVDILECASPTEITGKHCAYEGKDTAWSKADGGDPKDDKMLLRPYSTTAKQKLLGAGMWSQLTAPFPTKRFVVKCTFDVEAKIEKPLVRFAKGKEFHEVRDGWFAGALTGCSIVPPKNP